MEGVAGVRGEMPGETQRRQLFGGRLGAGTGSGSATEVGAGTGSCPGGRRGGSGRCGGGRRGGLGQVVGWTAVERSDVRLEEGRAVEAPRALRGGGGCPAGGPAASAGAGRRGRLGPSKGCGMPRGGEAPTAPKSWVVGRGSWVVGRGSWVVGRGSLPLPVPIRVHLQRVRPRAVDLLEVGQAVVVRVENVRVGVLPVHGPVARELAHVEYAVPVAVELQVDGPLAGRQRAGFRVADRQTDPSIHPKILRI